MEPSKIHQALARHAEISGERLKQRHPEAVKLFENKGIIPGKIREHAVKLLTSGTLAASLLLASPALGATPKIPGMQLAKLSNSERHKQFSQALQSILPHEWKLNEDQEQEISKLIESYWGIDASASFQNNRLNHAYGLIGAEQHLPRYTGDNVANHDEIQESGITPATGAWSYFAQSKNDLTHEDILREKYYVAVQTLYLPDWNTNTKFLKDWYKYRKVVVVNPANGKIIVCDIADAGPALRTGKHFGGSPEVMHYLELDKGMKKGAVLLFFLDEREQPVPLGPVEYNVHVGQDSI